MNNDFEKSKVMKPIPHLHYINGDKKQAKGNETENSSWSIIGKM